MYRQPGKSVQSMVLHIPPVLPANLKQRVRNLAQRAEFHGFHQLVKQVPVGHGHLLELLEARRGLGGVALVQPGEHVDLVLLFLLRGADDFGRYHCYGLFSEVCSSCT